MFFVGIYDFFARRRGVLFGLLGGVVAVCAVFALRVRFDERVTSFFPDDEQGRRQAAIFEHLKVKDRIVVMFSGADADLCVERAEEFERRLTERTGDGLIRSVTRQVDEERVTQAAEMIYGDLPLWLDEEDYARLDTMDVEAAVAVVRRRLSSPLGIGLREVALRDPLGLASANLGELQQLSGGMRYELYDGHIFAPGLGMLIMVVEPGHGVGDTGANEALVAAIEDCAGELSDGDVSVEYFGEGGIAVHNARRIKADTMLTLTIALAVIVLFIFATLRSRWAVVLIVAPVAFGAVFALGMVWILGHHTMSAIAIGAGSAIMGVALSYSIHVVSHANHVSDPRRIVRELAWPLTVGGFTTIGALLGLTFTHSQLLRDFGLFAALTLVGTTIFCLIFLPHFLGRTGHKEGRVQRVVDRIGSYPYDRKRWLVWGVSGVVAVSFFFYGRVGFDSDMMNLNYMPGHLSQAERKLSAMNPDDERTVLFVSTGVDAYRHTGRVLDSLRQAGEISRHASAVAFVPTDGERERAVSRWEDYWTGRREGLIARVEAAARKEGFRENVFAPFYDILRHDYSVVPQRSALLDDWVSQTADGTPMLISQAGVPLAGREHVYSHFGDNRTVIVDRGYYANMMARSVRDDFQLVLWIASLLIFVALLLSYGRVELTLMAFMPMFVSWVVILGLMAVLGIEFNIVNIILSTFIFGIGDDFSIFIMDGMLARYRTGERILSAHKRAIFFSAFTIVVGLGAMIFARHPALRSISAISIVGILTVIVVSYVLQPVLFGALIGGPIERGGAPWTLAGLLRSGWVFLVFVVGCLFLQIFSWLPVSKATFHRAVCFSARMAIVLCPGVRRKVVNEHDERFDRPAVIVANHQSLADILVLLSLTPRVVMVTKSWVWRSPFFGRVVRRAGFFHTADGYENLVPALREKVAEGYSVVVFPEGTRSDDGQIGRMHKGAFFLAEELVLDILPVLLYGTGLCSSKRQPLYIKRGILVAKILGRIVPDGTPYKERTRQTGRLMREEYAGVYEEFNRAGNPYFHEALMHNYLYKGPVLEWYMRIKVRMERDYDLFDRLLPRAGHIVDIGCGYGAMSYMLAMLSDRRTVLGVDYDAEKIAVAAHCFARDGRTEFVAADAGEAPLPRADAFVLSDVLHYLDYEGQEALLGRCFGLLNEGGVVVVRDGDAAEGSRHRVTERTERWSTRIVKFNKTVGGLHFTDSARIIGAAQVAGFSVRIIDDSMSTSNKIYIMTRNGKA